MEIYPTMNHLPGFWDPENWADNKWDKYYKDKRSSFGKRLADWFDQYLHQLMGRFMSREGWEKREAKQWPSSTGSYDPCADHYNWLCGAGRIGETRALKEEAQRRRPGFLD